MLPKRLWNVPPQVRFFSLVRRRIRDELISINMIAYNLFDFTWKAVIAPLPQFTLDFAITLSRFTYTGVLKDVQRSCSPVQE